MAVGFPDGEAELPRLGWSAVQKLKQLGDTIEE